MLTVDFDRLELQPGDRVLDMGAGAGRHSFELYRRGADVVAFDQDVEELAGVRELFGAMLLAGEVPVGAEATTMEGDALALPFADGEFDRVVAAEVLEHIPADIQAIDELVRVLRPGGTLAVSVPRWLPEIVCWKLSEDYHNVPGGHIRIYSDKELISKITTAGLVFEGKDYAHGLHAPYWWIKCAVGVRNDDHPLAKAYHRLLVWEIMKQPRALQLAGRVLDPMIGKSLVLYFRKPARVRPAPRIHGIPAVPGILSADDVRRTAASIVTMQHADGAIAWTHGDKTDAWNHVEAAMALLVGGEVEAAEAAYEWCLRNQRADGTWPVKVVGDEVVDDSAETNMSAYLAVGVWHHWLVRGDLGFVERFWPAVRDALEFVVRLQLPFGGIAWIQDWVDGAPSGVRSEALLTGSSSVYHSLRAGSALAALMQDPQPTWKLAAGRLRHAIHRHRGEFLDKATFSMDWYYPVLGGAVRGPAAHTMLASRWDDFVVADLGVRCVDTNPWVTGAETCELVMALEAIGDRARAEKLFGAMQHLRESSGGYFTGWVWPDEVYWPHELTTYTAAAVILAADQLSDTTPGADIMRGSSFGPPPAQILGSCGCAPER